jgi:hypothetical protein
MKYLALAMLLAVMQASVPVPRKATDPKSGTAQSVARNPNSDQTPAQQAPPLVQSVSTQPNQDTGHSPAAENTQKPVIIRELPPVSVTKDWWDRIYICFTGVLIVVGIIGVRAAYKTLGEMKAQRVAMQGQLAAMQGQLGQMESAGKQTDKIIEHASKQVIAAEGQVELMKASGTHTEQLAQQAVKQSDLTQRQLELTHRPWIAIEAVSPASDLVFDQRGAVLMLNIQIRNVGNSIAKHVISFVDYAVAGVTQMPEIIAKVTAILKKPIDPNLDHGKLLFPGQADISQIPIIILPKYIDEALKSGHFKDQRGISFDLLVCFDYQSTIDPGIHHQTRCTFGVANTPPGGGPLMGIFLPSKVYPAQQMVIFYRGFGAHAD